MSECVSNARDQDPGKESFDDVYDRPDPRPYFHALQPLEYQPPLHGQPVFRTAVAALRDRRPESEPLTVLDLCCSYGVNAALLNHELTLDDLYARYTSPDTDGMSTAELERRDREFFVERRERRARCVGIDAAANAVRYATRTGLLDAGFAEDLESSAPSPQLRDAAAPADMITITGGVGYIYTQTIDRVVGSADEPPWVVAFVLRMFSYEPIAEALSRYGLMTERYEGGTFLQRRFANAQEQQYCLDELARAGVDSTDKEAEGYYHTNLFVSRPPEDAADMPLERLLATGS
jgi:hypothetical protein